MDFRFDSEVEAFEAEVSAWFDEVMAPERTAGHSDPRDLTGLTEEFERAVQARAGERGYLGLAVDADNGGRGLSISHQAAFNFHAAAYGAPVIDTAMTLAGHAILEYGTAAERTFFVPRLLSGEFEMCIAYTEEQAGSDLSAITTRADAEGDGYRLSGTKVLITGSHKADWCCTVALTSPDGPPRSGMSMFVVDTRAPGVHVSRRETMNEWTLGEIRFDRVRLEPDALLGERDGGWRQLLAAVQAERSGMFYFGFAHDVLTRLIAHCRTAQRDGVTLVHDPIVHDRLAALRIGLDTGLRLARRTLWLQEEGQPNAVLASMTKVYATEFLQELAQAATELSGHAGSVRGPLFGPPLDHAAGNGRLAWEYLERVHGTISVGANELQRDAIANIALQLPRRRK